MKKYTLSDIVKNPIERWNGRYLITHNLISHQKGKFLEDEKNELRKKLDFYGNTKIVPQKDINRIYNEYQNKGFPHYDIDFDKFKKVVEKIGEDNGNLNWDGYGSEIATFFHPHIFECKHKNKMSALEFFNSEEDFKRGIEKILCLYSKISDSNVREICRNESASSRINNFPPRIVVKILNHLNLNNVDLLDPCHGFSGRLIGAYSSGKVKSYTGIDLSLETHKGALKTKEWLNKLNEGKLFPNEINIDLIHGDCLKELDKFSCEECKKNVILTSPPFLNKEIYKGVEYENDYKLWLTNFVNPFISKCYNALKKGGHFILYVEKINKHDFITDVVDISLDNGFERMNNIEFLMSYGENNRDAKGSRRTIPILVFKK